VIAALYVERGGVYYGLDGVDPWDERRDARAYAGPWPVVAHPPCSRWCQLASVNEARYGQTIGEDGGCFAAALVAVRRWGGVLEHPAYSIAWPRFDLPEPTRGGWSREMFGPGWVTEVSQSAYGHRARKRTWLYYVGSAPPVLDWRDPAGDAWVSWGDFDRYPDRERLSKREAKATPLAFRDVLIGIARSAAGDTRAAQSTAAALADPEETRADVMPGEGLEPPGAAGGTRDHGGLGRTDDGGRR
jgi:hypothetical protein